MLFLILKLYYQLNSHVCIYLHTRQFQDCVMLHSCMSLHSLMVVLERILCFQVCHFTDNPFTPATHLPSFLFRIVLLFCTFILLKDLDSQSVKTPTFLLDFHLYLRKDS